MCAKLTLCFIINGHCVPAAISPRVKFKKNELDRNRVYRKTSCFKQTGISLVQRENNIVEIDKMNR